MATEYSAIKALNIDLRMKRGEAGEFLIPLYDPDDSSNPKDLSSYTEITLEAKYWPAREDAHFTLTLTGGDIAVSGDDNNELDITVSKADGDIKSGYFFYNVFTDTDEILMEGKLYVNP